MQIVCPNCATAYEVPDAVFSGRARKLRCESCGTQWRAGPPGDAPEGVEATPAPPQATPIWPEYIAPSISDEPRVFGQPTDAKASTEFRQALSRERPETVPQNHVLAADPVADSEDPFINLVMAARSRAIEFEPEPPPVPRVRISSPAFFGTLVGLFMLAMAGLMFVKL